MSKINVLQLVTSSELRGSETIAIHQITTSTNNSFKYFLCSLNPKGDLHNYANSKNVKSFSLNFNGLIKAPLALINLIYFIKNYKIHIIHVYGLKANLFARFVKLIFTRVIIVSAIHSVYTNRTKLQFKLDYITSFAIEEFISNTTQGADHYAKHSNISRNKFSVIYTGIDTKPYIDSLSARYFKNEMKLDPNVIVITFVAEINTEKGCFDLIKIISNLSRIANKPFVCLCLGKDKTNGQFLKKIYQYKLNNYIRVLGFCEKRKVNRILNISNMQILPSQREGLPTSLLEAMSFKLPIVATNVGGIPDIIKNGKNGYILELNDLKGFSEKINKLLNDTHLRYEMGVWGHQYVCEKFSISRMIQTIEKRYELLLKKKKNK